jgi:hypothetical protein
MCIKAIISFNKGRHVMRTSVRLALTLLAITVACQAGLALAENYSFISGSAPATAPAGAEKATAQGQSDCTSCCPTACGQEASCGCGSCDPCNCQLGCEENCKRFGIVGFAGFDSFKGISDDLGPSNFGVVSGLNTGVLLPGLDQYGFGWQTGLSYGVYDFDGATQFINNSNPHSQQQIFVTTGFFRKAKADQRVSFGLVYDWMINDQWGDTGISPTLGQWRGQIEYAFSGCNAVGLAGTIRDRTAQNALRFDDEDVALVSTRAINQVNLFWHHKFNSGADSNVWIGVPEDDRLNGDGSLLAWTIGASVQVPLSQRLALYANAAYFHPSAAAGIEAQNDSGYDIGMGVVWYFGAGKARSRTINGSCSDPYMPVANNSNFLVDQNIGPLPVD